MHSQPRFRCGRALGSQGHTRNTPVGQDGVENTHLEWSRGLQSMHQQVVPPCTLSTSRITIARHSCNVTRLIELKPTGCKLTNKYAHGYATKRSGRTRLSHKA